MSSFVHYAGLGKLLLTKPLHVKRSPEALFLCSSNICNFTCKMCGNDKYVKDKSILGFDDFKKIYDQIRPKKISLTGFGEPFMNPRLLDMVKYSNKHGSWTSITTNFSLVSDIIPDIVKSGLDLIMISIDGATSKTYCAVKPQGDFDQITSDIKALQKEKKEQGVSCPKIRFNYVILEDTIGEIADFVELTKKLDVDHIKFYPERNTGYKLLSEMSEDEKNTFRRAQKLAKKYGINTNLQGIEAEIGQYISGIEHPGGANIENNPKKFYRCLYPWLVTMIEVNGMVGPCPHYWIRKDEEFFGNIKEQDWEDIWNGEKYKSLRKAMKGRKAIDPRCRECRGYSLEMLMKINKSVPGFLRTPLIKLFS